MSTRDPLLRALDLAERTNAAGLAAEVRQELLAVGTRPRRADLTVVMWRCDGWGASEITRLVPSRGLAPRVAVFTVPVIAGRNRGNRG